MRIFVRVYCCSRFVCRNMELRNELQAAEFNAYFVTEDSFLAGKAF